MTRSPGLPLKHNASEPPIKPTPKMAIVVKMFSTFSRKMDAREKAGA
jgi:hypothetical protein